jgi:RHH-type rel operon transcriptional repressor/antitoxin RelB
MLILDLPEDIEKRLTSLSLTTGRTVQYCAREVILEYLEEVEDRYLALNGIQERHLSEKSR